MSISFTIVLLCQLLPYCLHNLVNLLQWNRLKNSTVPKFFQSFITEDKYTKAKEYQATVMEFGFFQGFLSILTFLTFLLFGGFGAVDRWTSHFQFGPIVTALIYFGVLTAGSSILNLPFSLYSTFVIEEKFGFNRTTLKTFVLDLVKGLLLGAILLGPLTALLLWIFLVYPHTAWLLCWAAFTLFQLLLTFLAPSYLMPLFYKFSPIAEGSLKSAIETYIHSVGLQSQGVYSIDGSKRSSKANAFFTGFGKFRRIVLFDTLIEKHSEKELVAVLAHEVGHLRLGHIPKQIVISLFTTAMLFYLLSLFASNAIGVAGLGFETRSLHSSFTAGFLVFGPLSLLTSLIGSFFSKRFEFEADAYAARTTKSAQELSNALLRLSIDNLSNLDPHPWKVMLEYSHPPVVQRVARLATWN